MTTSGFNKYGGKHSEPIRAIFETEIKRPHFNYNSPDDDDHKRIERVIQLNNPETR